jgi:hypothetical protein
MLNFLKKEANWKLTENGAATYISTQSDCLDLFAAIGALRSAPDAEVVKRFSRAFAEDPDLAVKTLFFARDICGGLGERKVFRTILAYMAQLSPASVVKNLWAVPELGRYDDLLVLLDSPVKEAVLAFIKAQLASDIQALDGAGAVSLLGKWLPSVNAHNADTIRYGKALARALGMSDAEYRRVCQPLHYFFP